MTPSERANQIFAIVQKMFPDHDWHTWKIEIYEQSDKHPTFCGYTSREQKTIYVRTDAVTFLTVVHECCHAVSEGGHTYQWGKAMRYAAKTFELIGARDLPEQLRKDVLRHVKVDAVERRKGERFVEQEIQAGRL